MVIILQIAGLHSDCYVEKSAHLDTYAADVMNAGTVF